MRVLCSRGGGEVSSLQSRVPSEANSLVAFLIWHIADIIAAYLALIFPAASISGCVADIFGLYPHVRGSEYCLQWLRDMC